MNLILFFSALFVVGLQFFNNWALSKGNLKIVYPLIIVMSICNIIIDLYLCVIHPEQIGIMVYTISNLWAMWMATKGIKRLKEENKR
jgi:uncharacterized membrane protein